MLTSISTNTQSFNDTLVNPKTDMEYLQKELLIRKKQIMNQLVQLNERRVELLKEEWKITGIVPSDLGDIHGTQSGLIKDTSYPLPMSLIKSLSNNTNGNIKLISDSDHDKSIDTCPQKKSKRRLGLRRLTQTPIPRKMNDKPHFDDAFDHTDNLNKLELERAIITQIYLANKEKAEETGLESYRKASINQSKKLKQLEQKIDTLRKVPQITKEIPTSKRHSLTSSINRKLKRHSIISNWNQTSAAITPIKPMSSSIQYNHQTNRPDKFHTQLVSIKRSSSEIFLTNDKSTCIKQIMVCTRSINQLSESAIKTSTIIDSQVCSSTWSSSGYSSLSSQSSDLSGCTKTSAVSFVSNSTNSGVGSILSKKVELVDKNTPITPSIKEVPISQKIMNKFSKLQRNSISHVKNRLR